MKPQAEEVKRLPPAEESAPPASQPEDDLLSESFREEVGRVKELLKQRNAEDTNELLEEVGLIVKQMVHLAGRQKDLEEQTSVDVRARLEKATEEARRRCESTATDQDLKLFERQLEVIEQRDQAIEKALTLLERLKVRRDVAEHQLKQIRLDLSRAEASANVPELTSRLQDIRHEVDAVEAVGEALPNELLRE